MRLVSLVLLGFFFWGHQLLAAPRLLLVSPSHIRFGFYGTITGENFSLVPGENQVFILPNGSTEAVTVPVTKVIQVSGSKTQQKLTFILAPNVLKTPPRTSVPAEVWVVANGEASNRLDINIVPSPAITSVTPATAYPGDEIEVEIETFRTRLRPRGLSLSFGEGIEVQELTVTGPTSLTAHLRIAKDAPIGKRDITLRQGRLVIKGIQLFEILPPPQAQRLSLEVQEPPQVVFTPSVTIKGAVNTELGEPEISSPPAIITSLIPATGQQGQRLTLHLTGQNTHFKASETQILLGKDIKVEDLKILDETHLEATIYIDPEADLGPHAVEVLTGNEKAPGVLAFNVTRGFGQIKGYVKDAKTLKPLSGVRVALPDYGLSTLTNQNGYFELTSVPAGLTRVYFSLSNYRGDFLDLNIIAGKTIDLTKLYAGEKEKAGILLEPLVTSGEIPGATFEAILSQGLTLPVGPPDTEAAQKKIINAIVALGGSEMGVLDANGRQLNPQIQGEGILSVRPTRVETLADYWQMGETYSLAEILAFVTDLWQWEDNRKPTLNQWLDILNQAVENIWHDPENEAYDLVRFIFTQTKQVSDTPPILTASYRLNPIQAFFFLQSFFIYYVEKQEEASLIPPKSYMLAGLWGEGPAVLSDGFYLLAENDTNTSQRNSSSNTTQTVSTKKPFKTFVVSLKDLWKNTEKYRIKMEDDLAKDFLQNALKGSPESSKVVQLVTSKKWYCVAYGLVKDAVSPDLKKAMKKWLKDHGVDVDKLKKYYAIPVPSLKLAEEYSGKIMQALWTPFLDMYRIVVTETATPLPPIIDHVEYNYDPDSNPDGLKIVFYPSRTEPRVFALRKEKESDFPKIYYVIYRIDSTGIYQIVHQEAGKFARDASGLYYFVDRTAPYGLVRYRMIAIVRWRKDPLHVVDFTKDAYYQWVKSFAPLPSTTVLLPLMEDFWSTFSDVSIYFSFARSSFSNEYSFYNNPTLKTYRRVDVASPPPFGNYTYNGFVSIPDEGNIYALDRNNNLKLWADVYFAPPYQKGLAVDFWGNVYTENAASEEKFAGKIFKFVPIGEKGERMDRSVYKNDLLHPWLGTIRAWSNFGFSLGFVYPVYMADLCYGFAPDFTGHAEGLFILEQSFADIRFLPSDGSRTVASSLHLLDQDLPEHFFINEFSRCAYNWQDHNLYYSFVDEIRKVDVVSKQDQVVLSGHLTDDNTRQFIQISGFDIDRNGLFYLTDYYTKGVYVYVPQNADVLTIYSLPASPVDLALSADHQSLLVATVNGLLVLPKLLPFKVIAPEGVHFEGTLALGEVKALANHGYLVAPIYTPKAFYYQDPAGTKYFLFFDPEALKVFVTPLTPERPVPEELEMSLPPQVEVSSQTAYIKLSADGFTRAGCIVPKLPWNVPFIRVLSPMPGVAVSPGFHLTAVVSRGIAKIEVYLDHALYREIDLDPQAGGCLDVSFEGVSLGWHLLRLVAQGQGLVQSFPVQVVENPAQKVLAGVVVEENTGFPMQGLEVKHEASGLKGTVDLYGVYQLLVPKEAEEQIVIQTPGS